MSYKKLSELQPSELKKLYENNNDFAGELYERVYSDMMVAQADEADNLGADAFEYRDHYTSFYLSTPRVYGSRAPEKIAGALDADYMTDENAKLYKRLCDKIDEWENMTTDEQETDKGSAIYEDACELCDQLADGITAQLRAYEDITTEQVEDALRELDIYGMSDWETDGEKVFEHITKVYR